MEDIYEDYYFGDYYDVPKEYRIIDLDKLKRNDEEEHKRLMAHRKRRDELLEPVRKDGRDFEASWTEEERQFATDWEIKLMTPYEDEENG